MRPPTRAIHCGQEEGPNAPLAPSIHVSTTFEWESFDAEPHFIYGRYTNRNREMLEETLAALENAKFATAYGSGMAAMNAALSLAQAGDRVLIANDVYGGTQTFGEWLLPRQGIEWGAFDIADVPGLTSALERKTRLIVFESPTNPTIRIADIRHISDVAHRAGALCVFDNTFATPCLQNPLDLGADVVMHSTTKTLGGHSDVLGGALLTNDPDLQAHFVRYAKVAGGVPGPFDCWLTLRGIRSLFPRMKMQCENALSIAEFLRRHPRVSRVHYPGLPSDPGHELARTQMKAFGSMLAFGVDDSKEATLAFAEKCRIFRLAASLGGCESSLSYPPVLSHAALPEEERIRRGITPDLLRASIGLEAVEDLLEDLEQALR